MTPATHPKDAHQLEKRKKYNRMICAATIPDFFRIDVVDIISGSGERDEHVHFLCIHIEVFERLGDPLFHEMLPAVYPACCTKNKSLDLD